LQTFANIVSTCHLSLIATPEGYKFAAPVRPAKGGS